MALALAGAGFAVGTLVTDLGEPGFGAGPVNGGEVHVTTADGDERNYTLTEAAARIEELEETVARRRRSRVREAQDAGITPEDEEVEGLFRPDGSPYPLQDVIRFALDPSDASMQLAAIRALRRFDDPKARATLQEIFDDPSAPSAVRVQAAKALARPPHRDYLPEELVAALEAEDDPAVRLELAVGVARLRERGAWMSEISELLDGETDPKVREHLFAAVARSARDPAAKAQLLEIAVSEGKSVEERRAALRALNRGRPSAELLAAVGPLLDDRDPTVRERALAIMAGSRKMSIATLDQGLADDDATVRARALQSGLRHLNRFLKNKKGVPRDAVAATVSNVVRLATSDPDPEVRRSGVSGVWSLPKREREPVLEAGRIDIDPRVRLTAYANSKKDVARSATPEFLSALDSDDKWLRDYAYRQLQRLHGVDAPYSSQWNDAARSRAVGEIRSQLTNSGF